MYRVPLAALSPSAWTIRHQFERQLNKQIKYEEKKNKIVHPLMVVSQLNSLYRMIVVMLFCKMKSCVSFFSRSFVLLYFWHYVVEFTSSLEYRSPREIFTEKSVAMPRFYFHDDHRQWAKQCDAIEVEWLPVDRGGGEVKRRRCDVRKLNTKDMDQAEAAKKYVRVSENCVNWVSRISNLPDR